jgi:hypothetical protein
MTSQDVLVGGIKVDAVVKPVSRCDALVVELRHAMYQETSVEPDASTYKHAAATTNHSPLTFSPGLKRPAMKPNARAHSAASNVQIA